jgi:hypothetical protein
MPRVTIDLEHAIGVDEAVHRLKSHYDAMKTQHQSQMKILDEQWEDAALKLRFQTFGMTIQSNVSIEPSRVTVQVELPLMAAMFKGKIEQEIRRELGRLLAI